MKPCQSRGRGEGKDSLYKAIMRMQSEVISEKTRSPLGNASGRSPKVKWGFVSCGPNERDPLFPHWRGKPTSDESRHLPRARVAMEKSDPGKAHF